MVEAEERDARQHVVFPGCHFAGIVLCRYDGRHEECAGMGCRSCAHEFPELFVFAPVDGVSRFEFIEIAISIESVGTRDTVFGAVVGSIRPSDRDAGASHLLWVR